MACRAPAAAYAGPLARLAVRAGGWQGSRRGTGLCPARADDAARRPLARLAGERYGPAGKNVADKALCRVLVPATGLDQVNGEVGYLVGRIARIGVEVHVLAEDERVGCFADSRYLVRP
jgi:hypothetical protein